MSLGGVLLADTLDGGVANSQGGVLPSKGSTAQIRAVVSSGAGNSVPTLAESILAGLLARDVGSRRLL